METLLIFWAFVWICKNAAEDVMFAAKGKPSPRRARKLRQIESGQAEQRYGVGGYIRDFADDLLKAKTAKRREMAEAKKTAGSGEAKPADEPPADPNRGGPRSRPRPPTSPRRTPSRQSTPNRSTTGRPHPSSHCSETSRNRRRTA